MITEMYVLQRSRKSYCKMGLNQTSQLATPGLKAVFLNNVQSSHG